LELKGGSVIIRRQSKGFNPCIAGAVTLTPLRITY
jgi:hypothetical protein